MRWKHLVGSVLVLTGYGAGLRAQTLINALPAKAFGQISTPRSALEVLNPTSAGPNLVEGREFNAPQAAAVDMTRTPPALYVADTGNHRVLGWLDAAAFGNGAKADIVIGQRDFNATVPHGYDPSYAYPLDPSKGGFSSGLSYPSALAVDFRGNLFVVDAGNNRILRFPSPFSRGSAVQTADLVIGQTSITANSGNLGASADTPAEQSIKINGYNTGGVQTAGLAINPVDNSVWFADAGNHRILRYDVGSVSAGSGNVGPGGVVANPVAATLVLGQADFKSNTANPGRIQGSDRLNKSSLRFPGALAFDSGGNLYAVDDLARVLVWKQGITFNKPADRLLGLLVLQQGQTPPPAVNDITFGFQVSIAYGIFAGGPRGLFMAGDCLWVVDTINHRLVRFDPMSTWPAESSQISPNMAGVYGQDNFTTAAANGGSGREPSAGRVSSPAGAAFHGGTVYVVDTGNHRVLASPYDGAAKRILPATRVLGQTAFEYRSPNLIEGREFAIGSMPVVLSNGQVRSLSLSPQSAYDTTSDPPRLYIADTGNNRILGFADARRVKAGDRADLVIGQVDFSRSLVNSPTGDANQPGPSGLLLPSSVALDKDGNLWVADTGNGRALRFPRPFDQLSWGQTPAPDIVLGQPDFTTRPYGDPAADKMYRPAGIAVSPDGNVAISDFAFNRVLYWMKEDLASGAPARFVVGQPDFTTTTGGNTDQDMQLPMQMAFDSGGRLYVSDAGNQRVLIYGNIQWGETVPFILPVSVNGVEPTGIAVSQLTGELWVADARGSRIVRYPEYYTLLFQASLAPTSTYQGFSPRAVMLDPSDNVFVIDAANRLLMHFPTLGVFNGANGFARIAPAMRALLTAPGVTFSTDTVTSDAAPMPLSLNDIEVLVDGVPAPVYGVGDFGVKFVVPKGTTPLGDADFLVRRASTGQVLAYNRLATTPFSPGVLYVDKNPAQSGQARAINQDGKANSQSTPASPGQTMTIYLTGTGNFSSLPADGDKPGADTPVPGNVSAYVIPMAGAGVYVCPIVSSTLDPDEPSVWRIKVTVPQVTVLGTYYFSVIFNNVPSHRLPAQGGQPEYQVRPLVTISK